MPVSSRRSADGLPPAAPAAEAPTGADPTSVTLDLLEWGRLSAHVATLASTRAAKRILEHGLSVDHSFETAERLQREMEEAWTLEQVLASPIDLRGFSDIVPLVEHASKGGELDGESLVAIGESLLTASSLLKTLKAGSPDSNTGQAGAVEPAAAVADATTAGSPSATVAVSVLPGLFQQLPEQAALRRAITDAIDETGKVRDTAEPSLGELRFARREIAAAARRELGRIIQLKADSLATNTASVRDDRYVLQVLA